MSTARVRVREPFAVAGLVLCCAGAAVPFGLSDLSGNISPNIYEWVISVAFATVGLGIIWDAFTGWQRASGAAFACGGLWAITAFYVALDVDMGGWERLGLALIFGGISLLSFACSRMARYAP